MIIMKRRRIIIMMGSKSDLPFAETIKKFIENEGFEVKCEYAVSSAHRTPDFLIEKLRELEKSEDYIVIITVAGLSDALSGTVAGISTHPVIACPPDIEKRGFAKIFSSVMTPIGVPVLLAAKPENAALAAVKILALSDSSLIPKIRRYINKKREEVIKADKKISREKR